MIQTSRTWINDILKINVLCYPCDVQRVQGTELIYTIDELHVN